MVNKSVASSPIQEGSCVSWAVAYTTRSYQMYDTTYENNILLGDYAFASEGMNSVRQVIFKKVDTGFIQGFGPADVEKGREVFIDPNDVVYDPKLTFIQTETCPL